MSEFLKKLVDSDFMPHGHCYLWSPEILWLQVTSDALIGLSYYVIPIILFYFIQRRREVPFSWMFFLFAAFIFSCGTTYLINIWTVWNPVYWLEGSIKLLTGAISMATALLLIPLLPKALALRSPLELETANRALEGEIVERKRAETALEKAYDD